MPTILYENGKAGAVEIRPENGKKGIQISGTFEGSVKFKISVDGGATWTPDLDASEVEIKYTKPQWFPIESDRNYWLIVDDSEVTTKGSLKVEVQ